MDLTESRPYRVSFASFALAFVPFATLLGLALLAGEATLDPGFYRTVYTIWVTAVLVTPALCAFILPGSSDRLRELWLLFWTFSFAAYLVHMGYALLAAYHGSWREFIEGQGVFPAIINAVFTALWAADVALAWLYRGSARWLRVERLVTHVFVGLTFFASTVILKHGIVNVIGIAMTLAVVVCLAIRYDARRKTRPAEAARIRVPDGFSLNTPLDEPARSGR